MKYKYQALECDANGRVLPNGAWFGYATKDEFREGLRNLAKQGWRFAALHPWHLKPIDIVYIHR